MILLPRNVQEEIVVNLYTACDSTAESGIASGVAARNIGECVVGDIDASRSIGIQTQHLTASVIEGIVYDGNTSCITASDIECTLAGSIIVDIIAGNL